MGVRKYLIIFLALSACSTSPKYKVGDCVDYALSYATNAGKREEFREIFVEFRVKSQKDGNYVVSLISDPASDRPNKEESESHFILPISEVDNSQNMLRCPK